MRKLLETLIKNKISVVTGIVVIIFLGLYAQYKMPTNLFPKMNIPIVNIITHYPGASSKDMEILVSRPIEEKMMSIPGVKRVSSTSVEGISSVTVEFNQGISVFRARQLVVSKLAEVKPLLPSGATPFLNSIGTRLQNIYGFVVYGGASLSKLYDITKYQLSGRLMEVGGVSSIQILGGKKLAIWVSVSPLKLKQFGVTLNDIKAALKTYNISLVGGYINRSSKEYLVRGEARLKSIKDIKSIPIKSKANDIVTLGDIAQVYYGYAPQHYDVYGNGLPAVAVIVKKQPNASTIRVANNIERALKNLKKLYPEGTKIKTFYNQAEIIEEARHEITNDLIFGALLVVLILWLFLGDIKPTLIVAFTIPLTFLATLFFMQVYGLGLNVITMVALVLAIGMIVDDSIVVTENIYRHALFTLNSEKASIEGAVEISGPDASGTFTTVAAFLPLVIVGGMASIFLKPFAFTISTALLVSLILSLTVVPVMFSKGKITQIEDDYLGIKVVSFLKDLVHKFLNFSFKHKFLVLFTSFVFFVLAIGSAFFDRVSFLPPIDEGAILIEYVMPPGTSLKESNRIGKILSAIALLNPNIETVFRRTGSPEVGFQVEGVNRGEITMKLKPKNVRTENVNEIINDLRKIYSKFSSITFMYHQPTQEKIDESFSGMPAMFGVTIYGNNENELIKLSQRVQRIMSSTPGINDIINNTKVKIPQIVVKLNYPKLALYGLSPSDVLDSIRAAKLGIVATHIIKNNRSIPIYIKLGLVQKMSIESLKRLPITNKLGENIPLSKIASIKISYLPFSITHLNGQREITLTADIEGNIGHIVSSLKEKLSKLRLPKGYSVEISGQYKVMMKSAVEIGIASLLAVILIYLIMAMQFRSLIQPFVILITIPFSLAGAFLFLFITRQVLNISVGMAVITLIGVAVNNAIVLVDYANRMKKKGMDNREALLEAVSVRLRPILLTSATTISALIPTAIGTTIGSHIFQSFSVAVIGGLITGMYSTLILVPLLLTKSHKSRL